MGLVDERPLARGAARGRLDRDCAMEAPDEAEALPEFAAIGEAAVDHVADGPGIALEVERHGLAEPALGAEGEYLIVPHGGVSRPRSTLRPASAQRESGATTVS